MNSTINEFSLDIIDSINRVIDIIDENTNILLNNEPSTIIDFIDQIEKNTKEIETIISPMIYKARGLSDMYKKEFSYLLDLRYNLNTKINDRKSLNQQMNTTGMVDDGEHELKEIRVSYDGEGSIDSVYTDVVLSHAEYTYLNIIKSMGSEGSLLEQMSFIATNVLNTLITLGTEYNGTCVKIKMLLNDGDFINNLTSIDKKDLKETIDELKSNVSSRRYSFSRSKKDVTKLFQTYLDICGNYALYCKAVGGYTQICMESFFGDGCELC